MKIHPLDIKPKHLYLNQGLILLIALITVYVFYIRQGYSWFTLFYGANLWTALIYGTAVAVVLIVLQIAITYLPEKLWEDDGTNLIFYRMPYHHLLPIMALGAVAEEVLFRLAIQTGLMILTNVPLLAIVVSSLVFSLAHVRYLKKPVLFLSVYGMSIGLGGLYWWTNNIWSVVWSHFIVNMAMIYFGKKGKFIPKAQQKLLLY